MMMIWLQLAEGGPIGGYDATTFAQYFLFMFLARQSTPTWVIYLMDRGVKNGELTPYLLQPMHPIWHYASQHWGELLARLPIILPILAVGLTVADAWSWSLLAHLPAFLLGLAMAWVINFIVHMTVGLIAFWSDNALGYDTVIYQLYIMLGGVVIPVELFPETMQRVLAWTPFPYVLDFPVRVMIGRIEGMEMLAGFGDPAVLDRRDRSRCSPGVGADRSGNIRRAGAHEAVFQTHRAVHPRDRAGPAGISLRRGRPR